MYWRRFAVSSIPTEASAFEAWIRERWDEKDKLIEDFLATGRFPADAGGESEFLETEVRNKYVWEWLVPFAPLVVWTVLGLGIRKVWKLIW